MVCIRIAEPASDAGAVGKVMQAVTLLHQTGAKTGSSLCRAAPPGAVVIVVGMSYPGECV